MQSRLKRGQTIILEHMQQRCLACIVETEEEQFGVLVGYVSRFSRYK